MVVMEVAAPAAPLTVAQAAAKLRTRLVLRQHEIWGAEEDAAPSSGPGAAAAVLQAVDAGVLRAARGRYPGGVRIDASSFCAWLLRQVPPPPAAPAPVRGVDPASRALHPASAAAWIAFGDAWAPERVASLLDWMHRLQLMLCDHKAGRIVLEADALELVEMELKEGATFTEAACALEGALRDLRIEAYAADDGRILHAGDFSTAARIDVLHGRFVADDAVAVFSPDWERAAAAAARIGAVRLSGRDVLGVFGRRRSTAMARKRAAAALLDLFEAWRRGESAMPTRATWERDLGRDLAGTAYAAGAVWTAVTADPRYVAARARGRRSAKNRPT